MISGKTTNWDLMRDEHTDSRVRLAVDAIWNRGELDRADGLFAADYVNHGGLIPDLVRGPEAVKLSAALFRAAFPELQVTVDTLMTHGDSVALRWSARTSPSADPDGSELAGEGASEALRGMTFGRLSRGKIVESWTTWDGSRRPPEMLS